MRPTIYQPSELSQIELPAMAMFSPARASDHLAFCEHGNERGAGPSLLPDRVRIQVSLPMNLDRWLADRSAETGLPRATIVRRILSAAQRAAA